MNNAELDLVVGATGELGSRIALELRARGRQVRAMIRSSSTPADVSRLQQAGAECTVADLKDPDSLANACQGVSHIYCTASSTLRRQEGDSIESVDRAGQLALISAAEAAGVRRFIFASFPEMPEVGRFSLQSAKREVESRLRAGTMDALSLQYSWFLESWLSPALGFNLQAGKATVYAGGEGKISWISIADAVQVAVATGLDASAGAAGCRSIWVGGEESLSFRDIVRIAGEELGRSLEVTEVPVGVIESQITENQDPLAQSIGNLMLAAGRGFDMKTEQGAPANVLLRSSTSVRQFIRKAIEQS